MPHFYPVAVDAQRAGGSSHLGWTRLVETCKRAKFDMREACWFLFEAHVPGNRFSLSFSAKQE